MFAALVNESYRASYAQHAQKNLALSRMEAYTNYIALSSPSWNGRALIYIQLYNVEKIFKQKFHLPLFLASPFLLLTTEKTEIFVLPVVFRIIYVHTIYVYGQAFIFATYLFDLVFFHFCRKFWNVFTIYSLNFLKWKFFHCRPSDKSLINLAIVHSSQWLANVIKFSKLVSKCINILFQKSFDFWQPQLKAFASISRSVHKFIKYMYVHMYPNAVWEYRKLYVVLLKRNCISGQLIKLWLSYLRAAKCKMLLNWFLMRWPRGYWGQSSDDWQAICHMPKAEHSQSGGCGCGGWCRHLPHYIAHRQSGHASCGRSCRDGARWKSEMCSLV